MKIFLFLYLIPFAPIESERRSAKDYFISTCCSTNQSETIQLICQPNEFIRLNFIEIYSRTSVDECLTTNSIDIDSSPPIECCRKQTKCFRRLTKYSKSRCDQTNSCSISSFCSTVYHSSCLNSNGIQGEFILIHYSCFNEENRRWNRVEMKSSRKSEEIFQRFNEKIFSIESFQSQRKFFDQMSRTSRSTTSSENNEKSNLIFLFIVFIVIISILLFNWIFFSLGKSYCRSNSLRSSSFPDQPFEPKSKSFYSFYRTKNSSFSSIIR